MLAGYLPFDDDPANPEGDNINLLYKYIVSTPLTFPEYVTPHARDLLRRILIPDPRKRADLFEVARHSWLSDYAHVVAHVTSSTTRVGEVTSSTAPSGESMIDMAYRVGANLLERTEAPLLARSASVREPTKATPSNMSPVGGLSHQGKIDPEVAPEKTKTSTRDPKRRTVQVEYVAPQSQTARGESTSNAASPITYDNKSNTPIGTAISNGMTASNEERGQRKPSFAASSTKPLPQEPSVTQDRRSTPGYHGSHAQRASQTMAPPARPQKDIPRSVSDSTGAFASAPSAFTAKPATGGSMTTTSRGRMPSRGSSYSQPLAPTVAATNAQGRLSQPKNAKQYNISAPIPQPEPYSGEQSIGRPSTQQNSQNISGPERDPRGHKRSNTFGNVFGRSGSMFGRSSSKQEEYARTEKKYPPTSMKAPIAYDSPRQSTESRRSSFGFGRKNSDLRKSSDPKPEKTRRFSLLPASFSFKGVSSGSTKDLESTLPVTERRPSTMQQAPASRSGSRPQTTHSTWGSTQPSNDQYTQPMSYSYDGHKDPVRSRYTSSNGVAQGQQRQYGGPYTDPPDTYGFSQPPPGQSYLVDDTGIPNDSEASLGIPPQRPLYPAGFNSYEDEPRSSVHQSRGNRGVLQKNNRKFADAYEKEQQGQHGGSSGAARRVMDFFRRRGKARAEDDRV